VRPKKWRHIWRRGRRRKVTRGICLGKKALAKRPRSIGHCGTRNGGVDCRWLGSRSCLNPAEWLPLEPFRAKRRGSQRREGRIGTQLKTDRIPVGAMVAETICPDLHEGGFRNPRTRGFGRAFASSPRGGCSDLVGEQGGRNAKGPGEGRPFRLGECPSGDTAGACRAPVATDHGRNLASLPV
jgi:hypothetical protein